MMYSRQTEVTKGHIHLRRPLPGSCGCAVTKVTTVATIGQTHHNLYALFPSYYCTKYIDNYSNTTSGIPVCLGLFVSCLSDRLVDIVSDLPLLSLGIFIANPSLSGIWLSLLYLSVAS